MNANSGGFELDDLLERELRTNVGGLQGPSPAAGQSAYHAFAIGGSTMSFFSSVAAAASTKAVAGLAVAALATGGGAVAATAASGSPNPSVWGKTVTAAVTSCKDNLKPGQHGIGQCVSAVAKQKGVEERTAHSASSARTEPPAGAASSHPAGLPSSRPAGPPSSVPAGKPSTPPEHQTGRP